MLTFVDHGLFELAAVALVFLVGRRFLLRRSIAFLSGGVSIVAPLVLFFLATDEVQTWLLAALLAWSMLNIALIVELACGNRFEENRGKAPNTSATESFPPK